MGKTLLLSLFASLACIGGQAYAQGDTLFYFDFADEQGWSDTILNSTNNAWVYGTAVPSGDFPILPIASTTAANGYWLYDSDAYCSADLARLFSPVFDFTNEAELEVRWQEQYRRFQGVAQIEVSTDGGQTFVAAPINPSLAVNDFSGANPTERFFNITDLAAGQDSVVIAFLMQGACDYAWMIDDVAIVDEFQRRPNNDLTVDPEFVSGPANFATPVDQVEDNVLYFVTDVLNNGGVTATGVQLFVGVFDALTGTLLYTDSLAYGDIPTDSLVQNQVFPNGFPMPTEVGSYAVVYEVVGDSTDFDNVPADNRAQVNFVITEDYYAKAEVFRTATRAGDSPEFYELGNLYLTPTNTMDDPIIIDTVQTGYFADGFGDDGDDTFIEVGVYGYRGDLNDDGMVNLGDIDEADAELVVLSIDEVILDTSTPDGFAELLVPANEGAGTELPRDAGFIGFGLGVSYEETTSPGNTPNRFFVAFDDEYGTGAYNLALDSNGLFNEYFNYGWQIAPNDPDDDDQMAYNPAAGLWINAILRGDTAVSVVELTTEELSLFPSVTTDLVYARFDLSDEAAGLATLTIRDLVGHTVVQRQEDLTGARTLTFDMTSCNPGLYFLDVTTAGGQSATRKFMVQR